MKFSRVHVVQPGINITGTLESLFTSEGTAPKEGWTLTGHTAGVLMVKGGKTFLLPWARVALTEVDTAVPEKVKAA